MALDMTSFDAALKQHYTDDEVQRLTLEDHPFLAMVQKYEKFGGKNLPIPIIYGNPQGRSATFSDAQANKTSSQITDFVLTRAKDYSLASIDGETMDASENDPDAFMEAATTEIDGAFGSIAGSLATALYRSGTGSIAQVGSGQGTKTMTLKNTDDIVYFEVGMSLRTSATDGGAHRTGTEVIEAVDRDNGTVDSTSATWDAVCTAIAADDYICVEGDLNAKVKGLDAWLPSSVTSTSFFGVDRTVDSTRLGGCRYDGSSDSIEEALITGASRSGKWGGRPGHCFMSFENYANLEKDLGSKKQYVEVKVSADIGFTGLRINGPKGEIKIFPDQNCQSTIAWMLDMRHIKLYSLKKCPRILNRDGNRTLREYNADAEEIRVGYYAQLGFRAPGHNCRITLPS